MCIGGPSSAPRRVGCPHAAAVADGAHEVRRGCRAGIKSADGRPHGVTVKRTTGTLEDISRHLLAFFGCTPSSSHCEWGFELEKKAIKVDTAEVPDQRAGDITLRDHRTRYCTPVLVAKIRTGPSEKGSGRLENPG